MSDLAVFRAEVRDWLDKNAPDGVRNLKESDESACWGGRKWKFQSDDQRQWLEMMVDRGWTVPDWPEAYGGAGLSKTEANIIKTEMRRLHIRPPLESLGIWMLGPALLKFGTEDQKLEHLPKIARGEIRWAQGYSEPNAGSDLASVRTKCEDKGDHYLVNGQKTWTSYGDKCDWIFALVRTDAGVPKHQGISFILIDMDQPGVETRPIKLISGTSHFTETFFDNVKVPKDQLVGEPGQGWSVTKYLLNHEREMIGSSQMSGMGTATLSSIARDTLGKDGIAASGRLRSEIIDAEIDGWLLAIALEKLRDESKAGTVSPFVGSTLKIAGTEIAKRRAELWMTLTGLRGMTAGSAPAFDWLFSPATTIAGGSNEIQLNILAKRALELPGG